MSRIVVITGASGGIGAATARLFSESGWQVIGVDRVRPRPSGVCFHHFIEADLAEEDAAEKITHATAGLPGIDALVNNAAIQITKPLSELSAADWLTTFNVNVRAAGLLIGALADSLQERRGSVVNVGSVHAVATSPGMAAYVASKGALVALTRAAALELAPHTRVNAVLPGAIDTPMLREGLSRGSADPEQATANLAARTPLGRIGVPEETAQAILFLADAGRSGFITGQTLVVDGGATARLSTE